MSDKLQIILWVGVVIIIFFIAYFFYSKDTSSSYCEEVGKFREQVVCWDDFESKAEFYSP